MSTRPSNSFSIASVCIMAIYDIICISLVLHVLCRIKTWKENNDTSYSLHKIIISSLVLYTLTILLLTIYYILLLNGLDIDSVNVIVSFIGFLLYIACLSMMLAILILRIDITFRDTIYRIPETIQRIWKIYIAYFISGVIGIIINALREDNDVLRIVSYIIIAIFIILYVGLSVYVLYTYISSLNKVYASLNEDLTNAAKIKTTYYYITKITTLALISIGSTFISVAFYVVLEMNDVSGDPYNIILPFDVLLGCLCTFLSLQMNFNIYQRICCYMEKVCLYVCLRKLIIDKNQIELQVMQQQT